MRPLGFRALVVLGVFAACGPRAPVPAAFPVAAPNEASIASLRDRPGDFTGRSVTTHGWLARAGEGSEGPWLELVDDPSQAQPRPLVIVLAAAVASGDLQSMEGQQLEIGLDVERPVTLADGRTGLRALPVQIATAMKPVGAGAEMPAELSRELAEVSKGIQSSQRELFSDPKVGPDDSKEPPIRLTLLDSGLQKPLWSIPGAENVRAPDPRMHLPTPTGRFCIRRTGEPASRSVAFASRAEVSAASPTTRRCGGRIARWSPKSISIS